MPKNQRIVLASRPSGTVNVDNFRLEIVEMATPRSGEMLIRHHYLSLDPYMRGRMNDAKSYASPQKLNEVMIGGTVGEVVVSNDAAFGRGDFVFSMGGWQNFSISEGQSVRKLPATKLPLSIFLGVVGMPGITAWYGINHIVKPKPAQVVVVSAATGAVGSVAGQLAKLCGAETIGIAGGPDKCRIATSEFGFSACLDHRDPGFAAAFNAAVPNGIDGVFENVGGAPLALSMRHLKPFARIAICGLVASGYDGTPTPLADVSPILVARAHIEGFIVSDHLALWPQALNELADHVADGSIRYRETVAKGLNAAPQAFIGLLNGANIGKQVVRLIED
jgi:NADPH-dependent curcumin reductase CurA